MLFAVIPVRNEEKRVGRLLCNLEPIGRIGKIIIILNGSDEYTISEVKAITCQDPLKFTLVHFYEALGIDVPRAVGAHLAYTAGASHVLFLDGDLVGDLTIELQDFITESLKTDLDLALVNCYPQGTPEGGTSDEMFFFRRYLNAELSLLEKLGPATPSHGPHIVSRRLLAAAPWEDFAVPPTLLVHTVLNRMVAGIAGTIPHAKLGSSIKDQLHSQLIIETIAGDCLEAVCLLHHRPRDREYGGRAYAGYHPCRRFDLLRQYLGGRLMS